MPASTGARVETALAEGDAGDLWRAAHKLKGTAAELGAEALREYWGRLEQCGRTGDLEKSAELFLAAKAELEQKVEERTRKLVEINRDLELSNTELQQYAYIASHDLQEPLRKILTFSRMVQERFAEDKPEALPYLNRVINASERMRKLIDDLLNYSKLTASAVFKWTDLNEILNGTLSDLELTIKEKAVQLVIEDLPKADVIPGQIRQVFQNLISNAIKFSRKDVIPLLHIKGETIREKSIDSPVDREGPFCRISIRDNGIGFEEKYLDKIFTLFQRLHGKEEYEGTGIGLAIVKKLSINTMASSVPIAPRTRVLRSSSCCRSTRKILPKKRLHKPKYLHESF